MSIKTRPKLKKVNYYDGLFMQAENFTTDQYYHSQMLSLHNQEMHKGQLGVTEGLDITGVNDLGSGKFSVAISDGFAQCLRKQKNGRKNYDDSVGLLWQGSRTPVDIPDELTPAQTGSDSTIYVAIAYGEDEVDENPDQGPDPIYIEQQPAIGFSAAIPEADYNIVLGTVTMYKNPLTPPEFSINDKQRIQLLTEYIQITTDTGGQTSVNIDPNSKFTVGGVNPSLATGILQANGEVAALSAKIASTTMDVTGIDAGTGKVNGGTMAASSDVTIGGTLGVTGATTLSSTLDVTDKATFGDIEANSITITGSGGGGSTAGKVYRDNVIHGDVLGETASVEITTNIPMSPVGNALMYKLTIDGYSTLYGAFRTDVSGVVNTGSFVEQNIQSPINEITFAQADKNGVLNITMAPTNGDTMGFLGLTVSVMFFNITFSSVNGGQGLTISINSTRKS